MDNNRMAVQACIVDPNTVNVPRDEYDDLICARNGIHLISKTFGKYGANEDIVKAVCKQFGYIFEEETPDA